ncbi:MAG: flagellar type III secretion system pore protein FliP [Lachnospiraceae bacterium]|nr:flagellar type III secretion system pore protein FliP [Lachnospiraceae bacterium]
MVLKSIICLLVTVGILCILPARTVLATSTDGPLTGETENSTILQQSGTAQTPEELQELNIANTFTIEYNNGNGQINGALRILITLTLIAIAPLLLLCLTSYTRVLIVLHFVRAALNTQTAPPNQILVGISLFLTLFIMTPTATSIYTDAYLPYEAGDLTEEEALTEAVVPIREFMYRQAQTKDVELFMSIARQNWDGTRDSIPLTVLIPSFIVGELRYAFLMGFIIYIPFIIIDMVVASALMSMGMMMLPPTTISMPFKILLFVMADGWSLIIGVLVRTFN